MPIRRQFHIPLRRNPHPAERPEPPKLSDALNVIRQVFSARPRPYTVQYCTHCFDPRQMSEFLVTKPEQLPVDRLESVLFDAYWTWGDWPALAHYVPRLLELYSREELSDPEVLFYKLLLAARPELIPNASTPKQVLEILGEVMRPEERKAIFQFLWAATHEAMKDQDLTIGVSRILEAFTFLAAFAGPIAPVIDAWKQSRNAIVRGRYTLFLAEWALRYDPAERVLEHTYLDRLTPYRGNAWVLGCLAEPAAVEEHLAQHLRDVECFDPDLQSTVGVALDWARCAQLGEESSLARQWKDANL